VVVTQGKVKVDGVESPLLAGQELLARNEVVAAPRASHLLDWTRDLMMAAETPLVPASTYSGGALVAVKATGQESRLSLRRYHVDVHIEDGFARTTIDQTYFNPEGTRLEGTFYFPLPPDASLSRLAMYVDGKLMEGGVAEHDHARQTFETIVNRQKDPALLEWLDGSTFKMRVFPLEPRQEKRIILGYTQRLGDLYGRAQYRFPAGHSLQAVDDWSMSARLKKGAKITWDCRSHAVTGKAEGDDMVLQAALRNTRLDRDIVIDLVDSSQGAEQPARFSTFEQEGGRYFMVRYRPQLASQARKQRRDWVFLFESSADRDPLLARTQIEIIRGLLENAEHDDTFVLLTGDTRVHAFAAEPKPATAANVAEAIKFLERAHLIGALDLGKALAAAEPFLAKSSNPYMVHIGSGVPAMGERKQDMLEKSIPQGTHYIGVGVGHRWNRSFMKRLADRTDGYFTQINPDEPVSWRAFDLLATINTPRWLDVKVVDNDERIRSFLTFDSSVAQGEELCAVTRLPAGFWLPSSLTVSGIVNGQPHHETLRVENVAGNAGYLPRTWARLEIDRLLAEDAERYKPDIIGLSKAMYLMSPYTSFLVLENDAMYKEFGVDRGRKDHWAPYACPERVEVSRELFDLPRQAGALAPVAAPGRLPGQEVRRTILATEASRPLPSSQRAYHLFFARTDPGTDDFAKGGAGAAPATILKRGADDAGAEIKLREKEQAAGDTEARSQSRHKEAVKEQAKDAKKDMKPSYLDAPPVEKKEPVSDAAKKAIQLSTPKLAAPLPPAMKAESKRDAPTDGEKTKNGVLGKTADKAEKPLPASDEKKSFKTGAPSGPAKVGGGSSSAGGYGGAGPAAAPGRSAPLAPEPAGRPAPEDKPQAAAAKGAAAPTAEPKATMESFKQAGSNPPGSARKDNAAWFVPEGEGRKALPADGLSRQALEQQATILRKSDQAEQPRALQQLQPLDESVRRHLLGGIARPEEEQLRAVRRLGEAKTPVNRHLAHDLLGFAPGMQTGQADVQAVLEAEALEDPQAALGKIDPGARVLIDQARKSGWQEFEVEDEASLGKFRIVVDGQGRFAYDRTLVSGLRERVVHDGKTFMHLYPELGVGARRHSSRAYRDALSSLMPWTVPPAEDLAHGADVVRIDTHIVGLKPLAAGTSGRPSWIEQRLVFADDGRLAERRFVQMPGVKLMRRETYSADGTENQFDGDGRLTRSIRRASRIAPTPDLTPDLASIVVLPLPYRTEAVVLRALGLGETRSLRDLSPEAAQALLGCAYARQDAEEARRLFREAIEPHGHRLLGHYTILAACGVDVRQKQDVLPVDMAFPKEPLARYLASYGATDEAPAAAPLPEKSAATARERPGFMALLSGYEELSRRWMLAQGDAGKTQALAAPTRAFLEDAAGTELGAALLNVAIKHDALPYLWAQGWRTPDWTRRWPDVAFSVETGWAGWLASHERLAEADRYYRQAYEHALVEGLLPAADHNLGRAFAFGAAGKEFGPTYLKSAAQRLAAIGERPTIVNLARQCDRVGARPLADELLDIALAGIPDNERVATAVAGVEYLRDRRDFTRAEALLKPLLTDPRHARSSPLWRLQASLAEARGEPQLGLKALEQAAELDFAGEVDAIELRADYAKLLAFYRTLATTLQAAEVKPPAEFLARVEQVADRWRALDADTTTACQAAAGVLITLGKTERAWDYLTSPLAEYSSEAAPWKRLAEALVGQGQLELADRAYVQASAAEPKNAQLLWDRAANLKRSGKDEAAREVLRELSGGEWQTEYLRLKDEARRELNRSK
jgi:hypothetical protein